MKGQFLCFTSIIHNFQQTLSTTSPVRVGTWMVPPKIACKKESKQINYSKSDKRTSLTKMMYTKGIKQTAGYNPRFNKTKQAVNKRNAQWYKLIWTILTSKWLKQYKAGKGLLSYQIKTLLKTPTHEPLNDLFEKYRIPVLPE